MRFRIDRLGCVQSHGCARGLRLQEQRASRKSDLRRDREQHECARDAIATDDTNVYWIDDEDSAIHAVPIAGGAVTTIVQKSGGSTQLLVAHGNAYWTTSSSTVASSIVTADLSNGSPNTLYSSRNVISNQPGEILDAQNPRIRRRHQQSSLDRRIGERHLLRATLIASEDCFSGLRRDFLMTSSGRRNER
jgi:hypothetical protein